MVCLKNVKIPRNTGGVRTGWVCICDCGNKTTVDKQKLKRGVIKSCGCMRGNSPLRRKDVSKYVGVKFGKLAVLGFAYVKHSKSFWSCICDCGNKKAVSSDYLLRGVTKSCGCYVKESSRDLHTTHGQSKTRIYYIWKNMKKRCSCNCPQTYRAYYYEKGIRVCDEWLKDFTKFRDWANENGYTEDLTIDRIDNNLGYNPNNCRWVNNEVQARNSSQTKWVILYGEKLPINVACKKLGVSRAALRRWEKLYGDTPQDALNRYI